MRPGRDQVPALAARGQRVRVHTVQEPDLAPYRIAVGRSQARLSRWNPVDPSDLRRHLVAQSDLHRTFMVHALVPEGEHGLVAKINVANVVRGRFRSAHLGYDAYDPYAGRGLFREGLTLVVSLAFAAASDGGMGLHRLEANVQPGNVRSADVLRSLGFRHEGSSPGLLWLSGPDGREDWRDHERFVVTSQEWPARPYPPPLRTRRVVLVNGQPGPGRTSVAETLSTELGLPVFQRGGVSGAEDGVWTLVAGCPAGAVLQGWWPPGSADGVRAGLLRARVDPASAVEVRCDGSVAPALLGPDRVLDLGDLDLTAPAGSSTRRALVRLALQVRAATAG